MTPVHTQGVRKGSNRLRRHGPMRPSFTRHATSHITTEPFHTRAHGIAVQRDTTRGKTFRHAPQGRVYVRHAVCDGVAHDKRRNVFTHPLRRRMPAHRASLLARLRVCIRGTNNALTPRWAGWNTACRKDLLKPVTDRPRRLSDGLGAHFLHVVTLCRNV